MYCVNIKQQTVINIYNEKLYRYFKNRFFFINKY